MKRLTILFLLFSFSTWIIPLGAFIEAAKEKQICNGRRSICLCTLYLQKLKRMQQIPTIEEKKDRDGTEALQFPSFGSYFIDDAFFYSFAELQEEFIFEEYFHYISPMNRGKDLVPRLSA